LKVSLLARNRVISSVFNNDYAAAGWCPVQPAGVIENGFHYQLSSPTRAAWILFR
jgi:hypothetical protein